ncbi:MAG: acyl-CoA/acyl-ACP dehydrogenase [Actinobacteria bacterium]|nr:acyl-CoA/acyl-ACP dehydrogenase [Actinomycetota bacterium]
MHLDLDDEERALQAGIRELIRGRFPFDRVRAGFDRTDWKQLADAGVFALRIAESEGGLGLGMTHATVVYEELGRALVPGPLVATGLAAAAVDGAAIGDRVVGLVEGATHPHIVEHPGDLDDLLVLAPKRIGHVDPRSLDLQPVARPLDPLTPVAALDPLPEGELVGETWAAGRFHLEGAVLTAALQLGIALETTDRAVAFAKQREQFGRPIGSFQAVKHLCADMLVRAEVARAAVYAAAVHLDDPASGDVDRAVATAKICADDAALANAKSNIQVHGGMGFTWEAHEHLFLKRAAVLAARFERAESHASRLAAR